MSDKNYSSLESLEQRIDLLVKRFEEQKGIIDSYIKREREWKKNKILLIKDINIKKLKKKTQYIIVTALFLFLLKGLCFRF